MREAVNLYKKLLIHVSEKGYRKLFNIANTKDVIKKDWLSSEWIKKNILNQCCDAIRYTALIDTHTNHRKPLYCKITDEQQISIPNARDKDIRDTIWLIANEVNYEFLPLREEMHEWYSALWPECRNISIKKMVEHVSDFKNIANLSKNLKSQTPITFLCDLYSLISKDAELVSEIKSDKIAIIPNQNGDFCFFSQLYLDKNVDDEYKNILQLLGKDIRIHLINNDIDAASLFGVSQYIESNYVITQIKDLLNNGSYTDYNYYSACFSVIGLYEEHENQYSVKANRFAIKMYKSNFSFTTNHVNVFSEEL